MPRLIPPGPERLAAEPVEDQREAETDTGTAAAVHEPEKANVPEQASLLKEFSDLFDEPVTNEPTSMRSGMPKDTRHPEAPVHTGGGMRSGSSVSRGEERGIEPNGSGAKGNDGNGLEQRAGRAQDQSAEDCARPDADTLSRGGAGSFCCACSRSSFRSAPCSMSDCHPTCSHPHAPVVFAYISLCCVL